MRDINAFTKRLGEKRHAFMDGLHSKGDALRARVHGINRTLLVFSALLLGLSFLMYEHRRGALTLPDIVIGALEAFVVVVGAYFVATVVLRLTLRPAMRSFGKIEIEQHILMSKAYSFLVYLVATIVMLWQLGVTVQNLTLILGFAATGLALALREVLVSYFVWSILLIKKPFRIGDHIRVGDEEGLVKHIGTFYVLLDDSPHRSEDFIRVPNKTFLEKPVRNFGRDRFTFVVRVPLPLQAGPPALEQVAQRLHAATQQRLAPQLDAVNERLFVVVECAASSYPERDRLRSEIMRAVLAQIPRPTA